RLGHLVFIDSAEEKSANVQGASGLGSLQAIGRTSHRPRCQQTPPAIGPILAIPDAPCPARPPEARVSSLLSRSEGGPSHRWRAQCSLLLRRRRDPTAQPKELYVRDPWSRSP